MVKLFRRHGLSIKPDAMEYCRQLVESLGQSASANIDEFIRRLSAQLMAHYRKFETQQIPSIINVTLIKPKL